MAKQCTKCGNYLLDDEKFCTRCGTNVNAMSNGEQQAQQTAPQSTVAVQQPVYQQYQQPPQEADDGSTKMSVGSWVGTIILTTWFGLVSIILLFVWGFGSNVPKAKANYCKAMLIMQLIAIGVGIIFTIIFFGAIFANINELDDMFNNFARYVESL